MGRNLTRYREWQQPFAGEMRPGHILQVCGQKPTGQRTQVRADVSADDKAVWMFETVKRSELETASEAYSDISGSSMSIQHVGYRSSPLRFLLCSSRKESVFVLCVSRFLVSLEQVRAAKCYPFSKLAAVFDSARRTGCWEAAGH